MKQWFRDNIKQYLQVIKTWVTDQIAAAKTELRTEMSSLTVTGTFKGSVMTVAEMPTGAGTKNGDWAVLKEDDGSNESGIYVKATAGWQFVADITSFDEALELLASNDQFNAGTATNKAATIAQIKSLFAENITQQEAQEDFDAA